MFANRQAADLFPAKRIVPCHFMLTSRLIIFRSGRFSRAGGANKFTEAAFASKLRSPTAC
ncbi:hypothetical protein KCP70_01920 [Salmonella enterica subsp. enterica]|nr:hypothetical protein KCP70_01920 [Salmonella enterica subsp. enterica]